MNFYYITGASRGIGKALVTQLLENPSNKVVGISRSCSIKHPNYKHFNLNLSDAGDILNFKFEKHPNAKKIVLINNAGTLGDIMPVGKQNPKTIIESFMLNLIAPSVLTNAFMKLYENHNAEKSILNISSGAGKNEVDGWSVYCASKAGLDMFSRVIDLEKIMNNASAGFKIFSIAPGVVDTKMQEDIREADKSNFSKLDYFIDLKVNKQLSDPALVAKMYLDLLDQPSKINGVVTSLRDY